MPTPASVAALERHQVAIYLGGLAAGAAVGLVWPGAADPLERAIYPVLGVLLYATFLQVPFTEVAGAFRDRRFLGSVLVLNFIVVPLVVAGLTAVVSLERAVLLGVLLTLLTPCIDYVIVFSRLAGADSERLVAAAPLLMLAQVLALPVLLWLFVGPELADVVEAGPFVEAFGLLIVLPLALAWATQALASRRPGGVVVSRAMTAAMVPLMALTLLVVVGSQVPTLDGRYGEIAAVVPVYAAFLVVMAVLAVAAVRLTGLDVGRGRALVFSGATRNSLVVLPLALALPTAYAVTPAVVVTQTLVELVGMLVYVRLVPWLVSERGAPRPRSRGPRRP
ncbi:arsenic resistance protein [Pimelobacter simplex]|uniref:arsenic resistance protein n=1 Tax=Nocardioides simplex TaxID=2045 RepID=UPI003AABADE2